jgi:dolichol-phosphate mannosyltransferase
MEAPTSFSARAVAVRERATSVSPGRHNGHAVRRPQVSVIVPTYREVENLPYLIDRIAKVRQEYALDLELLIVDDDSCDGTLELVASRPEEWLRLIVRSTDRGLSLAVLEGLRQARGDFLICMDADLSHPPESLPAILQELRHGADFVVGSRYVQGGTTAHDWGVLRWINSGVATLLARPFTNVRDPMAGFFALPRATFEAGGDFNPVGYKIGLELMVKCRCERVVEVPIHFANRRFGKSKLNLKQQLLYMQHLRRLYMFKYGVWSQLMQFLVVGGLGTVVNLVTLTLFIALRVPTRWAVGGAIFAAMTSNFVLNRRFSFSYARRGSWWPQYLRFVSASSAAALVNYVVTLSILARVPAAAPQLAALLGIAAGTGLNFAASRYLVFNAVRVHPRPDNQLRPRPDRAAEQ